MFEPTGTLQDIIPAYRRDFERLVERAERLGLNPEVVSAGRTCADQEALARQGPQVTGARGCESWHTLGRAVDLRIEPPTCENYRRLGLWWESIGGFWGGRWTQFGPCGDAGHFHMPEPGAHPGSPPGCPPNPADCKAYRQAYLTEAHRAGLSPLWALALGGAVAGVLWWRQRR